MVAIAAEKRLPSQRLEQRPEETDMQYLDTLKRLRSKGNPEGVPEIRRH